MSDNYHQVVATFNAEFRPTGVTCNLSLPTNNVHCYDCEFRSTVNPSFCGIDIGHMHVLRPSFLDFLAEHYPEHLI